MVSIENTSELAIGLTEVPFLRIPQLLTNRSVHRIRIPKEDVFSEWYLPELVSAVSAEILAEIKTHWEERNTIDIEKNRTFAILTLCDQNLEHTLRWHLRGLPVLLAVRKVRTGIVHYLKANEVNKAEQLRLNQIIQGFRIGNRVVLSEQGYCRQEMIGWEGVVITVREDYCLVQFDLQPKEIDGGDKKYQLKYQWISLVRPEFPQLKEKRIPPSPPILKAAQLTAEIDSSITEVAKIKSKIKHPPLPSKEEVKPEAKVKHTLQQLVENLKLFTTKNLEQSQDKPGYTAIELAEKLNVSRAKIYQMRSSGTLEAAGYRAESQGRSLLFVSID
jgi:hypothetical protein